jgi:hypothetical protein
MQDFLFFGEWSNKLTTPVTLSLSKDVLKRRIIIFQTALLLLIVCCVALRSSFGNSYHHCGSGFTVWDSSILLTKQPVLISMLKYWQLW